MRLVCGHGYNDSEYPVNWIENGKHVRCPIYSSWKSMIHRTADSEKYPLTHPAHYETAKVDEVWKYFSSFRDWSGDKYSTGYQLDKDLLTEGNTLYSTETCCFLPQKINNMFRPNSKVSEFGKGVRMVITTAGNTLYESYTKEFTSGKYKYLGMYNNPEQAFKDSQVAQISNLKSGIKYLEDLDFQDERVFFAMNNRIENILQNMQAT